MSKGLFITGTGTDVGKTYVSALIVKKLHEAGISAGYFKAAVSGNERGEDGKLVPGDAAYVKQISGIEQGLDSMCPYVYENAYSPHLAAQIEGHPVDMAVVKAAYERLCGEYDFITVEGSGGILCPIRLDDQAEIYLEDIIKALELPSVIVADAGLGTINSVVLTVEYMRSKGLPIKGIIFNHFHKGNVMEEDNIRMCERMSGVPVIATVPEFDIDIKVLKSLYQ